MESAELLDLLGNETRRRILALLAQKPCYVTELSDATGVSPKAVIDHLNRLEEAGLIEYRNSSDRRKYFSIVRAQRLEITIAPHEFGTTNGYLPPQHLDPEQFSRLNIDLDPCNLEDPTSAIAHLEELQSLAAELSRAQRLIHGEMNQLYDAILDDLSVNGERLGIDILAALKEGPASTTALARHFGVPRSRIERCARRLERADLIAETDDGWVRTL